MGITKSGKEHGLMDNLWDIAVGNTKPDDIRFTPQREFHKDSPNQQLLLTGTWVLEAALTHNDKFLTSAVKRANDLLDIMDRQGHTSTGIGGDTEINMGSHDQLVEAGLAALLWGAIVAKAGKLVERVEAKWRTSIALARDCVYTDADGPHVLIPGTRCGKPDEPAVINPVRDEVFPALLRGWVNPPRTPRVGSYSAAIPLLNRAFEAGAPSGVTVPGDLIGKLSTDGALPERFDYQQRTGDRGFYSWFAKGLEWSYDACWGAGRVDGATVLHWTQEEAIAYGEALSL